MADLEYSKIAAGDIGTQLFVFNKGASSALSSFGYALPITAGAEFGGDTESFEAPETDLDFVPKIGGRSTLNDISYTVNYTSEKYERIRAISDNTDVNVYMEVLSDGGAMIFAGTSGMPTLTAGDVRQITWTIIPSIVIFISDVANLSAGDIAKLSSLPDGDEGAGYYYVAATTDVPAHIKFDLDTIPKIRQDYYTSKNITPENDDDA